MGIITISRGSYSQGAELAQRLAKKLGYECISREILVEASHAFNLPEVKLNSAIQDVPSFFNKFRNKKEKYIAFISKAFLNHIQKDNIVYHGLAGHYFTEGIPNILKVRITASLEFRIKIVMDLEHISEDEARALINKIDSNRRKWSSILYGIDCFSPELYDIVLNINNLKIDDMVDIIFDMTKQSCYQTSPETMRKINELLAEAEKNYKNVFRLTNV